MARHRRSPVTRLLGSLSDDTKVFVDDLTARARSAEQHARDAVRHAVDGDESAECDRREIEELGKALADLKDKVNRLAETQDGAAGGARE